MKCIVCIAIHCTAAHATTSANDLNKGPMGPLGRACDGWKLVYFIRAGDEEFKCSTMGQHIGLKVILSENKVLCILKLPAISLCKPILSDFSSKKSRNILDFPKKITEYLKKSRNLGRNHGI